MSRKLISILLLFILCVLSPVLAAENKKEEPKQNVILITLDGVRFEEVWNGVRFPKKAHEKLGTELLPKTKARIAEGKAFGFHLWISNWAGLSQPGYRSILSGEFENRCHENNCPNIDRRTIFDDLYDQGLNQPGELATFSSWDVIGKCIESVPGRIFRNIKFDEYHDSSLSPAEQLHLDSINQQMLGDRPKWIGSRFDHYTYDLSKIYIQKHMPRLFYMQFVATDEYGHLNDYPNYLKMIRDFDDQLDGLIQMLGRMGEYGANTSIVVTTDHGRGRGRWWVHHSREYLSADRVWSFVIPSKHLLETKKITKRPLFIRSHVDIRPTVELLMGRTPKHGGKNKGQPLIEIQ